MQPTKNMTNCKKYQKKIMLYAFASMSKIWGEMILLVEARSCDDLVFIGLVVIEQVSVGVVIVNRLNDFGCCDHDVCFLMCFSDLFSIGSTAIPVS